MLLLICIEQFILIKKKMYWSIYSLHAPLSLVLCRSGSPYINLVINISCNGWQFFFSPLDKFAGSEYPTYPMHLYLPLLSDINFVPHWLTYKSSICFYMACENLTTMPLLFQHIYRNSPPPPLGVWGGGGGAFVYLFFWWKVKPSLSSEASNPSIFY